MYRSVPPLTRDAKNTGTGMVNGDGHPQNLSFQAVSNDCHSNQRAGDSNTHAALDQVMPCCKYVHCTKLIPILKPAATFPVQIKLAHMNVTHTNKQRIPTTA